MVKRFIRVTRSHGIRIAVQDVAAQASDKWLDIKCETADRWPGHRIYRTARLHGELSVLTDGDFRSRWPYRYNSEFLAGEDAAMAWLGPDR